MPAHTRKDQMDAAMDRALKRVLSQQGPAALEGADALRYYTVNRNEIELHLVLGAGGQPAGLWAVQLDGYIDQLMLRPEQLGPGQGLSEVARAILSASCLASGGRWTLTSDRDPDPEGLIQVGLSVPATQWPAPGVTEACEPSWNHSRHLSMIDEDWQSLKAECLRAIHRALSPQAGTSRTHEEATRTGEDPGSALNHAAHHPDSGPLAVAQQALRQLAQEEIAPGQLLGASGSLIQAHVNLRLQQALDWRRQTLSALKH